MGDEVLGLSGTGATGGLGKVITTTDQTGVSGTSVLAGESAGGIAGTLSCLI